ncbi:hypothetical protein T484DRAFT_1846101, partial [Baffinella frigidus]
FDNLAFWGVRAALSCLLAPTAITIPAAATVRAQAVSFIHLRPSQEPVGMVEGFDLARFNDIQPAYQKNKTNTNKNKNKNKNTKKKKKKKKKNTPQLTDHPNTFIG